MKYSDFEKELESRKLNMFSIGKSTLGKDILACHIGNQIGKQVLIQAGIHAREYVTSLLAKSQAERLLNKNLNFGVYFVFCTNPDGVKVVLDGFSYLREKERKFCEERNFDHKLFKANANLVDLNTNFDALWGQGSANRFSPYFESFVGEYPESELETKALCDFTKKIKPSLTLSYHTKGEVVYFGFDTQSDNSLNRDEQIGLKLAETLGFDLQRSYNSCGGFKDWVCDKFDIPSFTIEFGAEKLSHPLGLEELSQLQEQSKNIFDSIGEILFKN